MSVCAGGGECRLWWFEDESLAELGEEAEEFALLVRGEALDRLLDQEA